MQENFEKVSQKDRYKAALLGIKPDITEKDRKAAIEEFDLTAPTLSIYLNGKGENIDTASKLLLFFQERIENREKQLESVSA